MSEDKRLYVEAYLRLLYALPETWETTAVVENEHSYYITTREPDGWESSRGCDRQAADASIVPDVARSRFKAAGWPV